MRSYIRRGIGGEMIDKGKFISDEIKALTKRFGFLTEERKTLADRLIKEVAFMSATIEELQEIINDEGAVIESLNGNGFRTKSEHPAQKSYNTMIRNYLASIKQLNDLLPDAKAEGIEKAGESLKDFLKAGKK